MGKSLLATLCKVHLVADPAHRALGGVASFHLVRRFDAPSPFRHLFWVEHPYPSVDDFVVLLPDLARCIDLRKPSETSRRVRSIEVPEKPHAIGAHSPQLFRSGLLALGQPLVFDAPAVTLEPLRIGVLFEPLWVRARQSVQDGEPRLRGALPFAQDTQTAQYMSRCAACPAP